MSKTELLRKYEMVFILDSRLSEDERQSILKEVSDAVTKNGAKIINNQVWLDKQKMAFTISKCQEGAYYLMNFEAEGAAIEKIRSLLRINERVLRFLIAKVE